MKRSILIFAVVILALSGIGAAKEAKIFASTDESDLYYGMGKFYFNNGDFEKALLFFKKSFAVNPNNEHVHHNLAITYYKLDDKAEAIKSLTKAIEINPDYSQAYYSLGLMYFEQNVFDKAITNFVRTTELNPENVNAHFDAAVAYVDTFRQKENSGIVLEQDLLDLEQGLLYYEKVLELDANFPHAMENAHIVQQVLGYYEENLKPES